MKEITGSPFDFIGAWDFVLMGLGIFLRLLRSLQLKAKKHPEDFSFSKYFDAKHFIRWSIHVVVAVIAILALPQLFIHFVQPKYFEELTFWALGGSAVIGFAGYDIVRLVEQISIPILKKFGASGLMIILLSSLISTSCIGTKSGRDKRRALRKIEKAKKLAPEFFVNDTTLKVVTLTVPEYHTDTIVKIEHHDTTVVINNDRMTVKIVRDTIKERFYVEGTCKEVAVSDTVLMVSEKIRKPTYAEQIEMFGPGLALIIILFICGIIFFTYRLDKKLSKIQA